jgi:hypothetical protein
MESIAREVLDESFETDLAGEARDLRDTAAGTAFRDVRGVIEPAENLGLPAAIGEKRTPRPSCFTPSAQSRPPWFRTRPTSLSPSGLSCRAQSDWPGDCSSIHLGNP